MDNLEDNVLEWIQSQRLFEGVEGVLLAVSGGADSIALAFVLHRLVKAGRLPLRLVIGHVNHGLRGSASDGDEAFVERLEELLGVPVVCRRVDVRIYAHTKRLSIETAGRVLRLKALTEIARAKGCGAAATGHHADDQAETMVHRLLRGTGLRGLCGMRPVSMLNGVRFIRPLLNVRRAAIESYCREHRLNWRDDASNRSYAFTRNRIRHWLIPELQKQSPDAPEKLMRLAEECQAVQRRIEKAADAIRHEHPAENTIAFDRTQFARQSPWVQAELLSRAVQTFGIGLRDMTSRHYQEVMTLAAKPSTAKKTWPGNLRVTLKKNKIIFSRHLHNTVIPLIEPFSVKPNNR